MSTSIKIKIIPYKNCQLRAMYGMNDKPKKWKEQMDKIKGEVGTPDGQLYGVPQVLIIFAKLGIPEELLPDELDQKCKQINNKAA